jgi:quinol monooxygenase YgiN
LIFITAKFQVLPEHADAWPELSREFTEACRAEDGCLWFDWSRSLDDSYEYVLVEAFRDGDAGAAHVNSDHFKAAQQQLPAYLAATPKIVSQDVDQDDWSELGEMRVER